MHARIRALAYIVPILGKALETVDRISIFHINGMPLAQSKRRAASARDPRELCPKIVTSRQASALENLPIGQVIVHGHSQ